MPSNNAAPTETAMMITLLMKVTFFSRFTASVLLEVPPGASRETPTGTWPETPTGDLPETPPGDALETSPGAAPETAPGTTAGTPTGAMPETPAGGMPGTPTGTTAFPEPLTISSETSGLGNSSRSDSRAACTPSVLQFHAYTDADAHAVIHGRFHGTLQACKLLYIH
jgi:hypothetical protein